MLAGIARPRSSSSTRPSRLPARRHRHRGGRGVTSLKGIAKALNDHGVRTPAGRARWHAMQVARVLKRTRGLIASMRLLKPKPQMTSVEFDAALREACFGVDHSGSLTNCLLSLPAFR